MVYSSRFGAGFEVKVLDWVLGFGFAVDGDKGLWYWALRVLELAFNYITIEG